MVALPGVLAAIPYTESVQSKIDCRLPKRVTNSNVKEGQSMSEQDYTYRVAKGCSTNRIYRYPVIKRTAQKIVFDKGFGDRSVPTYEYRSSGYYIHFDTKAEALAYCTKQCERSIEVAQAKIQECQTRLVVLAAAGEKEKTYEPSDSGF